MHVSELYGEQGRKSSQLLKLPSLEGELKDPTAD